MIQVTVGNAQSDAAMNMDLISQVITCAYGPFCRICGCWVSLLDLGRIGRRDRLRGCSEFCGSSGAVARRAWIAMDREWMHAFLDDPSDEEFDQFVVPLASHAWRAVRAVSWSGPGPLLRHTRCSNHRAGSADRDQSALMGRGAVSGVASRWRGLHEHCALADLDARWSQRGGAAEFVSRADVPAVARSSPVQPGQEVRRCQRRRALLVARELTGGEQLAAGTSAAAAEGTRCGPSLMPTGAGAS